MSVSTLTVDEGANTIITITYNHEDVAIADGSTVRVILALVPGTASMLLANQIFIPLVNV